MQDPKEDKLKGYQLFSMSKLEPSEETFDIRKVRLYFSSNLDELHHKPFSVLIDRAMIEYGISAIYTRVTDYIYKLIGTVDDIEQSQHLDKYL